MSHVRHIPLADLAVEGGGTIEHTTCCVGGKGCCVREVGVEFEWGGRRGVGMVVGQTYPISVTFDTSHWLISPLKEWASLNIPLVV